MTPTTPFVTRLTTNSGVTWNPLGYGVWPDTPGDDARGFFHDQGRIYFVTDELTESVATEIWSIPANAIALPVDAVLEGTFTGAFNCDSIAGDSTYFYLTCENNTSTTVDDDRVTADGHPLDGRRTQQLPQPALGRRMVLRNWGHVLLRRGSSQKDASTEPPAGGAAAEIARCGRWRAVETEVVDLTVWQ